jgi:HD-GYP domain-containing protein (c-di-GMP phosphodiesterase class II)
VHDIGKVGINDSIISKEGRLTDQEYKIIKRHTIIGAEIVGRMKGLKDLVPLIRSHHERWDGRGYPDGLVKEEIPLGARILAVADTLDVIISDRPYRSTRSLREAKEEMVRCSGQQFDPAVVDALMAVAEDKGPSFFRNSAATVDNAQPMRDASATIPRFLKKSMTSN